MVLGTPGSGKSYAIVNNYIKQQIEKGFAMYIYDYKFPDLSEIAYNHLLHHLDAYEVKPQFFVINFDDPRKSHRCNPINPSFMTDISDAYESAYTIMLNLNRSWIQKQGDFFVESPIILLAAIIWFYCCPLNFKTPQFPYPQCPSIGVADFFWKSKPPFRLSFIGCPLKRENGRHEMWPNVFFKPLRALEYG